MQTAQNRVRLTMPCSFFDHLTLNNKSHRRPQKAQAIISEFCLYFPRVSVKATWIVSRFNYMVYMPTRRCMSRRGKNKFNGGKKYGNETWSNLHLQDTENARVS